MTFPRTCTWWGWFYKNQFCFLWSMTIDVLNIWNLTLAEPVGFSVSSLYSNVACLFISGKPCRLISLGNSEECLQSSVRRPGSPLHKLSTYDYEWFSSPEHLLFPVLSTDWYLFPYHCAAPPLVLIWKLHCFPCPVLKHSVLESTGLAQGKLHVCYYECPFFLASLPIACDYYPGRWVVFVIHMPLHNGQQFVALTTCACNVQHLFEILKWAKQINLACNHILSKHVISA